MVRVGRLTLIHAAARPFAIPPSNLTLGPRQWDMSEDNPNVPANQAAAMAASPSSAAEDESVAVVKNKGGVRLEEAKETMTLQQKFEQV